jgi:uncharacterized protein YcgI (DUF1989 family)
MSVSTLKRLAPQTGCALILRAGEALEIVSPYAEQVADLALFALADPREYFSAGRTLDYNECVFVSTGAILYSNRSNPLMEIELDQAGRHDYLLTPCSARMFEILYQRHAHPSCLTNLVRALETFGISEDCIHATFNAFMHVDIEPNGRIVLRPPSSKAGDRIILRGRTDLIVGLTACSSEHSNNGACKPLDYRIIARVP